jgi:hypothetical protein
MAENDDSGPVGPNQSDLRIETNRVLAEVIVTLESVAAGLESLQKLPESVLLRNQLEMLRGLVARAVESVADLHEQLAR